MIDLSHFFGPGAIKAGLKVIDHIIPGSTRPAVEALDEFIHSPGYTKHRIDRIRDVYDDHRDDISDFFEGAKETLSDAADSAVEFVSDVADTVGDFFGDLF